MFKESVVKSTKGLQPSKWDEYYPKFDTPGKTLSASLKDMTRAAASQFSARMNRLEESKGGSRKFHSGYNAITGETFVRVRPDDEIPSKEELEAELTQGELPVE